jgi:biotin carboxyl carrier protein
MRCFVSLDGSEHELLIEPSENGGLRLIFDGQSFETSVRNVAPGEYSVLVGDRSFNFVVGRAGGELTVSSRHGLNRVAFFANRRAPSAAPVGQAAGRAEIRAMMPGRVVEVTVKVGEHVERGQGIVVIEAMKMENEVKSPRAGTIVQVGVAVGQTVEKGDILAIVE